MKKSLIALSLALALFATKAPAQILGNGPSGGVVANPGASSAPAAWTTATLWLDRWCSSVNGRLVIRNTTWGCVAMSGDATLAATGALTLATVNANVGSFGSATACDAITVNAKGLITAISAATCTPAVGSITGLGTGVAAALGIAVNSAGAVLVGCTPTRAGDLGYWNGSAWVCLAGNNSGNKILQEDASGIPSWIAGGSGTVTSVICDGLTITATGTCPAKFGFVNCSLAASVSGNNLTIALKDSAGSDPSATSPCTINYRNTTLTTGSWSQVSTTAALSFVANASSTFGITNTTATCRAASSCPFRLWVVGINSGSGTVLGVVALSNASGVLPLNESVLQTSTACNACSTATARGTIYSTAAQTSKAIVILGYVEWDGGLATAGTYASGPTTIQTLGPGVAKPGVSVQRIFAFTTTAASTTSSTFQNTNVTAAITPTSKVNYINVSATGDLFANAAITVAVIHMFNGATDLNIQATANAGAGAAIASSAMFGIDTPNSVASQTYTVKLRSTDNTTSTSYPVATGGIAYGAIILEEIQG